MARLVLTGLAVLIASLLAAGVDPARSRAQADGKVITNSIGMKLALIPPGRFRMGSPAEEKEREEEEAAHEVVITRPLYVGVHEVTQEQYQKVMAGNPSFFKQANGGGPDHPVEQLMWNEAHEFCLKLSEMAEERRAGRVYRLPREAEWEYACRAGTTTIFHDGNTLSSEQANFNGNFPYGDAGKGPYLKRSSKVGSYRPNSFGLHDMHGNVWEWCADWYDESFYQQSPKEDPQGPPSGILSTGFPNQFFRVVRGGCWLDEGRQLRAAYRFRLMPNERYRLVGMRVACTVATDN